MSLLLGLEYEDEYDPRVRDELEQLTAAIQTAFNQDLAAIENAWTAVAYGSSLFTGSGAMTWTVQGGDFTSVAYRKTGKTLLLAFLLQNTSVGGTLSTALQLQLPEGLVANRYVDSTYHYKDNGVYGIGLVEASPNSSRLSFFTNTLANWSAATDTTDIRGQILLEVK